MGNPNDAYEDLYFLQRSYSILMNNISSRINRRGTRKITHVNTSLIVNHFSRIIFQTRTSLYIEELVLSFNINIFRLKIVPRFNFNHYSARHTVDTWL